jgi:hypothetical protein
MADQDLGSPANGQAKSPAALTNKQASQILAGMDILLIKNSLILLERKSGLSVTCPVA